MKKFEKPTINVEQFDITDVITTSGECDTHCGTHACAVD